MSVAAVAAPTAESSATVELALLRQTAALAVALRASQVAAGLESMPSSVAATGRAAAQASGIGRLLDLRG